MFKKPIISFQQKEEHFLLFDKEKKQGLPPIFIAEEEKKSVARALEDLKNDLENVTRERPVQLSSLQGQSARRLILVGTIEACDLLQDLAKRRKLDLSSLQGKWESFIIETVENPFDNVEELLVIAGSDARGAIYGMYELAEQMGVSPWYWWMDVPVIQQDQIYIKKGRLQQGEPSVKYRGFFINDEGPSLMTWVRKNYPDFTHEFYEKVFELTLRLKANYHWPAMWDSSFYEDDERNAETADLYGVVMGTSHHEPMARPHEDWKRHRNGAWDYQKNQEVLYRFWEEGIQRSKNYEKILTIGMRGDGDEAMKSGSSLEEKKELLEKIISDQREIISKNHQKPASAVPQLWALYKEVMEYYEAGLRVPDDVTLLWSDDNFGNLRRVPTEEERKRSGGAGIYYHLDYVGGPRSYKWVNTVPIQKIWEQMHKAYRYGADRIWILNVGDIKPMEFQMEFFLRMAWNIDDFTPGNLEEYSRKWASRTFGQRWGKQIAEVINGYTHMNGRIKPEHLNGGPLYHLENDEEADRVLNDFQRTVTTAEYLLKALPEEYRDAFFQVGYYPAKASFTVLKMYILAARNHQYAEEGRAAANRLAAEVAMLFAEDKRLTFDYHHRNAFGKWNHMMSQTHIGYTYWQQPEHNEIPETRKLVPAKESKLKIAGAGKIVLNNLTQREGYLEIFTTGDTPIKFKTTSSQPWLTVDSLDGQVIQQRRVRINIDWKQWKEKGQRTGTLWIKGEDGSFCSREVVAEWLEVPPHRQGHMETNGFISIEAAHFTRNVPSEGRSWEEIPHYGRTLSSMAFIPKPEEEKIPWKELERYPTLEYDFYSQEEGTKEITLLVAPSLNYLPGVPARVGISVDGEKLRNLDTVTLNGTEPDLHEWEESVIHNIRSVKTRFDYLSAGWHTLRIYMLSPVVVLQKILIDAGGVQESFLGSPESFRISQSEKEESANEKSERKQERSEGYEPDSFLVPGKIMLLQNQKEVPVFAMESGLFRFVSVKQAGSSFELYLQEGYQMISTDDLENREDEEYRVELLEKKKVAIQVSFRSLPETKENVIQLSLHSRDKVSNDFRMQVTAKNREGEILVEWKLKERLEKEEEKLFQLLLSSDLVPLINIVSVRVEGNQFCYIENFEEVNFFKQEEKKNGTSINIYPKLKENI